MPGKIIAQIYFYAISAASIALLVAGVFSTVTLLLNVTQYDKYPLRYPGENCEIGIPFAKPYQMIDGAPPPTSPSAVRVRDDGDMQRWRRECEQRVELERKRQKLNDLRNSIVFLLVGGVLFAIHFPQAKQFSKEH